MLVGAPLDFPNRAIGGLVPAGFTHSGEKPSPNARHPSIVPFSWGDCKEKGEGGEEGRDF